MMNSQGENEFRVRAVKRYVVTHFTSDGHGSGGCSQYGEFPNIEQAERVGLALNEITPGSTFATVIDKRERVGVFYAYTSEQADALMAVVSGFSQTATTGTSAS